MRALIILLAVCLSLNLGAQSWQSMQDTILTNNAYFALGTEKKDWKDARIFFRYDGRQEVLLNELGQLHQGLFAKDSKRDRFILSKTADPPMFYEYYDVVLEYFGNYDCYTIHVHSSGNKNDSDGRLLHDSYRFFINPHYQGLLDRIAVHP